MADESFPDNSSFDGMEASQSSCLFISKCDESLKPYIGQCFVSMEAGIDFYKKYAVASGFDIRLGTSKISSDKKCYMFRYIYCNREGDKHSAAEDGSIDLVEDKKLKRRRVSLRTDCIARIVLKFKGSIGFEVSQFVCQHNHPFVSDASRMFQKLSRKVGYRHRKFVLDCARANIGPMKSFRFFKESVGKYDDIGCAFVDFKNISRDLKAFVEGSDAQMVINNFYRRKEFNSAFYFDYEVDQEDKLKTLFWCDPISRLNFFRFGDVVSFDATYSTNRYNMIFAPFTGKDNHGKCVNFGAALLSKEDAVSYSCVFEIFKDCMGVSPIIIVTDQDLGMKAAADRVFEGTFHRLCMWHIMLKVPDKVPTHLKKDEEFNKRLCGIVWSEDIEPEEFEAEWVDIMSEYGLMDDTWFSSMYLIRRRWIPAFFRNVKMSGLMKTTSMSESSNCFFGRYSRARSNLLEFVMNYESAIDSQRYANANMNYGDEVSKKDFKTTLVYEVQAAKFYTSHIFREFQDELVAACFDCRVVSTGCVNVVREYIIADRRNNEFKVCHDSVLHDIVCSCKKFTRIGLLCSHMLCYMKNTSFDNIPDKYILGRWCKNSYAKHVHSELGEGYKSCCEVDESRIISGKLVSEFYKCLGLVDGKRECMEELLHCISELGNKFSGEDGKTDGGMSKQQMFEKFYGSAVPDEIMIHPPEVVKTKGSGSRLISRKEKAIRDQKKPLRKCSVCKQLTNHDARNCRKLSADCDQVVE